nr:PHP domain-containing protein [Bacteroides intestinalis]
MKKLYLSLAFLSAFTFQVSAQLQGLDVVKVPEAQQPYSGEYVYIPDVDGYKTLKCDFHTHTIFSDGDVKPENRVWEGAIRGLDVIAITDHIEYRPNKFITADHNESYRRAKTVEESSNLVVIPGAEITRSKPLGHINALFLKDANALDVEDPLVAIDNALEQGAFIMWNHPGWPNDTSTIYKVHKDLIKQKKIHGVELVNGFEYYPKAFNYCKEYNLTYMGNTDIHGVYKQTYRTDKQYGPMTIIFAKARSHEGVKEALFAGRSVVKFGDILIGAEKNLTALVKACLAYEVKEVNGNQALVKVVNKSTLNFEILLDNKAGIILGNATVEFKVRLNDKIKFTNTYITDNSQLVINVASLK